MLHFQSAISNFENFNFRIFEKLFGCIIFLSKIFYSFECATLCFKSEVILLKNLRTQKLGEKLDKIGKEYMYFHTYFLTAMKKQSMNESTFFYYFLRQMQVILFEIDCTIFYTFKRIKNFA